MPPAMPSVSASAETVITSLYEAGMRREALKLLLPAAAITVTPAADEAADRLVHRVLVRVAAVAVVRARLGDRHVDGLDQRAARVEGVALAGDPVHAADVPRHEAGPVRAEDAHGPQPHAGRDAHDADPVVQRADRARDVRPVAVAVAPGGPGGRGAVVAADDVEVGVGLVDAGVEDRDVRVHALVDAVDLRGRVAGRVHAPDAAGDRLLLGADDAVLGDERDVRVGLDLGELLRVQLRRVALERLAVLAIHRDAPAAGPAVRGLEVGVVVVDDDPAVGRVGLGRRLDRARILGERRDDRGGRRLHRGERRCGEREQQGEGGGRDARHGTPGDGRTVPVPPPGNRPQRRRSAPVRTMAQWSRVRIAPAGGWAVGPRPGRGDAAASLP